MKCQGLFSLKNKKKIKMSSAAVVISILRVQYAVLICNLTLSPDKEELNMNKNDNFSVVTQPRAHQGGFWEF